MFRLFESLLHGLLKFFKQLRKGPVLGQVLPVNVLQDVDLVIFLLPVESDAALCGVGLRAKADRPALAELEGDALALVLPVLVLLLPEELHGEWSALIICEGETKGKRGANRGG